MKYNNKGISAVVATVLIILITVAAVAIIWAAIIPMIQNQISGGTTCLDAAAALTVVSDNTCVETVGSCSVETCGANDDEECTTPDACENETDGVWTETKQVKVQVSRGTGGTADFDLEEVRVIIGSAGNTESETFSADTLGPNEDEVFTIDESDDIAQAFIDAADTVSVAAIVGSGNTQKECEAGVEVDLNEC